MRELARRVYGPLYRELVPGRVGGAREDPHRRRRPAGGQPRRRHPRRRPGDHARHRGGARAARLRPGRRDVQAAARRRHACGRGSAACSPTRTTPTACCASRSSSRSCSPRAPRAPARPTASATSCAASAGAGSSRSPCGPACRSSPSPWWAPRRRCRSSGRATPLAKALGLPYFPSPPTCCRSARCGRCYLPAKFKIRVLDPVHFDVEPDQPRYSRSLIMDESEQHPAADPGGPVRHAPPARVGLVRLRWPMGRRVLITGLGTFWGGRVAQALEADPTVDVIVGLDRNEPTRPARAHRVRPHRRELLDPRPHREGRPDRHDRAHVPRRRLHPDALAHDPRDQRDRHHEPVRGGVGAGLDGAQRGREVVDARLRRPPQGPGVVLRGVAPRRSRRRPWSSAACSRSRATCATSPSTTRTSTSPCCASPTCSAPTSPRRSPRRSSCPSCRRMFGFDPRFQFVHEDDVVRAILFVLDGQVPGIFNVAGDGLLPWSEVAAICGKRTVPAAALGIGLCHRAAAPRSASTCPPSCSTCCATAGASTTAGSRRPASTTTTPPPARSPTSSRPCASASMVGASETAYQYERDVEQFFRHTPRRRQRAD